MAEFIPGVLKPLFYIIMILTRRNPDLGPPGPRTTTRQKYLSLLKICEVVWVADLPLNRYFILILILAVILLLGCLETMIIGHRIPLDIHECIL